MQLMINKDRVDWVTSKILKYLRYKCPMPGRELERYLKKMYPDINSRDVLEYYIPSLCEHYKFDFVNGCLFYDMYEEKVRKTLMISQYEYWNFLGIARVFIESPRMRLIQITPPAPVDIF